MYNTYMANLALFFSRGISLQKWISTGLLFREIRIYQEHLRHNHFEKIYWFTYGNQKDENKVMDQLKLLEFGDRIQVLGKPAWLSFLPDALYSLVMPLIYPEQLEICDIYKSNQMDGAWSAYAASLIHKKKFYLRTGYTWSLFEKRPIMHRLVLFIEKFLYPRSHYYAVSSVEDFDYVKKFNPNGKGILLRNFIDLKTFTFRPAPEQISFVCVARLSAQKNLINLVKAFKDLPYELTIIGEGEEEQAISELLKNEQIKNVQLKPKIRNDALPDLLSKFSHFILPSFFEGNPKSLLEAMSLGMICVSTKVPGIREIIQDNKNGFLANETTVEAIKDVVLRSVSGDTNIRKNANEYVRKLHDIDLIFRQEFELMDTK